MIPYAIPPIYIGTISGKAFTAQGSSRGMPIISNGLQIGILVDDSDPTRAKDVQAACKLTSLVLVTVGQGEPATKTFHCALTVREWYPFWDGQLQLPYSWFPCNGQGWVAQAPGWSWGGFAGDNGTGPGATVAQYRSEVRVLSRKCPSTVEASF